MLYSLHILPLEVPNKYSKLSYFVEESFKLIICSDNKKDGNDNNTNDADYISHPSTCGNMR